MRLLNPLVLVIALNTAVAVAQPALRQLPSNGARVGDLVRRLPKPSEGIFRPHVIGLDSADTAFLFAAAGSVAGSGGTYFRSDVTLINHRSVDQRIAVGWIAQGQDNSNAPLQYFVVPANTPIILTDFVAQTLGKSGLGAVLVSGVTATLDADSSAQLDGFSRIWTPQPGAAGTVSQGFPSVSVLDSIGSLTAYALGNRHDSQYRTNVGVVNLDSVPHNWTIGVNGLHGSTSFVVSVPAVSMRQVALPSGDYGDLALSYQSDGFGFWWSAYGASVDNISGDSWSATHRNPERTVTATTSGSKSSPATDRKAYSLSRETQYEGEKRLFSIKRPDVSGLLVHHATQWPRSDRDPGVVGTRGSHSGPL